MFDADAFLNSSISTANDTKVIPCPEGDFMGIIDKIQPRTWQSKDGTKTGITLDVTWLVEDAGAKAATGRESVQVRQGIMLDVAPGGGLDMGQGKNIGLGRLREAVGKNNPGEVFSFNMLPGLMAKIKVGHRDDTNDPTIKYAEVKMATKLN